MFGRRRNRKRRTLGERLRSLWNGSVEWGRNKGPYVLLILVGLLVPWLLFEGYQRLASSSYLDVSNVDIQGIERADRSRLARHLHLLKGENIFHPPLEQAREQMSANPWIESVRVERRWPDQLVVRVDEHEPAAILATDRLAFVDREGRVFKTIEEHAAAEELKALPMISGLSRRDLRTEHGRRLFEDALEVVEVYREMGLADDRPLSDVHVDAVMGMTLVTQPPVTEIRLGRRYYRTRLERLQSLRDSLARRKVEPAYILLDQPMALDRAVVGPTVRDERSPSDRGG